MDRFDEIIQEMNEDQFNDDLGTDIFVGDKVRGYLDELKECYDILKMKVSEKEKVGK